MWEQLIFLLLFMFLRSWGLSALHRIDHSYSPCKITSPFNSDLVTASFEEVLSGTGCVTNRTVPKTGAEVHAINYHSDRAQRVELYLKDNSNNDFQQPVIIILSSNVKVHWLIRIKHNPKDLKQHLFVVSKGSGIRFLNKHIEKRPLLEKEGGIPESNAELLSWLLNKYGAVTSLSSFTSGTSITLTVGRDSSAPGSCDLQQNNVELSASAADFTPYSLEGCLVTNRKNLLSKHAYIIELKKVPRGQTFEVDLEIRRQSRQTVDKEFWLVLKSPSQVTWHVHTRKVQGYINIVANSYVDMSGIRMHTVAVRSEELKDSGRDLLLWVEYYLGPVAMYASVNNSNKIQITLPQTGERISHDDEESSVSQRSTVPPNIDVKKDRKEILKAALRTECDDETVTVTVDKITMEMLGIKKDMMSLLDPQCRAHDNGTHIYIQTSQDSCGTNFIDSQQGKMAYINTLVLHPSIFLDRYDDNLEDVGSGDGDVYSGSGEIPISDMSEVYMDDEDLNIKRRPLQIGFICEVEMRSNKPEKKNFMVDLELFQSAQFMTPVARFPVTVKHPDKRLYLQATITNEPLLSTKAESCWLSDVRDMTDERKYIIIQNSCPLDRSVSYHTVNQHWSHALPQSQRLSFTLENYVKMIASPSSSSYLKCYVTVCCIDRSCGGYNYPLCSMDTCGDNRQRHGHGGNVPKRLVVVGPVNLMMNTDQATNIRDMMGEEREIDVDSTSNIAETGTSQTQGTKSEDKQIVIEGLDSGTVVGIAFAAFIIGVLMMGILWFIHTHSGSIFVSGPFKRSFGNHGNHNGSTETERDYGETTPGSSVPIST